MLDCMEENGLVPNATLHHFTHPVWFEDLGAFTKEENISIFVDWSRKMFELFRPRILLWCTFNEPTVRPPARLWGQVKADWGGGQVPVCEAARGMHCMSPHPAHESQAPPSPQ